MADSERIKEVFNDAVEIEFARRTGFVREACGGDIDLRNEVMSLLASYDRVEDFLDIPAVELSAERIASEVLEPEEASAVGKLVGAYRIEKEIGRGGMGTVYLAARDDQAFNKRVAIKLLRSGTENDSVVRRFEKERQVLADLEHPNIARLMDGGKTENGLPYFVMEYVGGMPLDKYCAERELTTVERLDLFRDVCAAVACAHEHGIIHRDIKPSNIVVNESGVPKLLDFGIAKSTNGNGYTASTATAFRVMTPEYASPEQMRGDPVGPASDIYSLGVLLYQVLTGKRPYDFGKRSPLQIVQAVCEEEPSAPSSLKNSFDGPKSLQRDRDLDRIVLKALRKEPHRRYMSVKEFSDDIGALLEGKPIAARGETIFYRGTRYFMAHRGSVFGAIIMVIVFLLAAGYFTFWNRSQAGMAAVLTSTDATLTKLTRKEKGGTDSAEARDLYVRGMEQWTKRTAVTLRLSVDLFQQSIDRDPQFSLAYSGLANSYFLMSVWGVVPVAEGFPKAKDAALKAIELAPNAAEGHLSLAMVHWLNEWDWPEADAQFKKAVSLDPDYARAPHWYGLFLGEMGNGDEAIAAENRALELEPDSIPVNADLARVLYYARRYDESRAQYRKVMAMNPAFDAFFIEQIELYEATGNIEDLLALHLKTGGENPSLKQALAEEGMQGYWKLWLVPPSWQPHPPFRRAEAYAQTGQLDKAFQALDESFIQRQPQMTQLRVKPTLDPLRSDLRFSVLLKRLRLD